MPKSTDPIPSPLVAEGLAIIAKFTSRDADRDAKIEELEAIDADLKSLDAELKAINAKLIEEGAGRYSDDANHIATVVAGIPQTRQPDTFALPAVQLPTARELAGEHFKKLFARTETFAPRNGFDLGVEILLPPKKARELLSLCLVEGKLVGGRAPHVRWK